MEKEVEWVQDPGMATTRATQFMCTQAETWRMKTMLAKAMSMQGAHIDQAHEAISVITTDHIVRLEAFDFKLSALVQQVDTLSQKVTVLISLLRHTFSKDHSIVGNGQRRPQEPTRGSAYLSTLLRLAILLLQLSRVPPTKITSSSSCNGLFLMLQFAIVT